MAVESVASRECLATKHAIDLFPVVDSFAVSPEILEPSESTIAGPATAWMCAVTDVFESLLCGGLGRVLAGVECAPTKAIAGDVLV
jgi:hypothetical protein